jgi:hypothetical protein
MSRVEQGKTVYGLGISLIGGAGAGLLTRGVGMTEGWILIAGSLALTLGGFLYSRRASRNEYLDAYEDCQGTCKGRLPRRRMWRLPDDLPKKKGLAVCSSCFRQEMGGRSINPFRDRLAYAQKGEEEENTKEGKKRRKQWEKNRRQFQEALNAPITEEYLRANLMDPFGREHPEVRQALDALLKEKEATSADPRSLQSPKHGP